MKFVKTLLRRLLKWTAYGLFLLLTTGCLLELAFRYQWVDFYAAERRGLNHAADLQSADPRRTLLVLGDSFSAQPFSYVDVLRDSLPDFRVINGAVPGSGILEAELIARTCVQQYPPEVLVYQVYVGNDLWDLRRSVDSPNISRMRKLYWRLSDHVLFLRFVNYRLGQFKEKTGLAVETRELKADIPFSSETYSARERLIFRAEPALVQHSVSAAGRRSADLDAWLREMDALLGRLPESTRSVYLLVVPHCAQVNDWYAGNMERIGAAPFPAETRAPAYPFLERIRAHFAADARVQVVSPLPALQETDAPEQRLYYENDPHLNHRGQEVLGKVLLNSVVEVKTQH